MDAMHLLLGYNAATKGSLAVAASRCQIKAMELLVAKKKEGKIDNEKENEEGRGRAPVVLFWELSTPVGRKRGGGGGRGGGGRLL